MSIIRCKMCGGDMEISEGTSVAVCEYCGTKQTVPHVDNEKKLTLFSRANRLRLACEFDKAAAVYENLVAEFPEEAEAYWGLVLCKYGIEYVDDPATGKKIPTCHRSSFESILEDSDFEQACENADVAARRVYREEAKTIEQIRRDILEVSGKEQPYDIFICYKETDENGRRTLDSVMAQDVYDALTEKGYRVFFSRISLEDKLGSLYEPYIFAALNSAKVMLVFGTDYEYINAVWVKNEWSRFLKLMAKDKSKHLIPCYKNIDAYDMPKEFQKLQGQDLGKVGATQDLLRGIEKLIGGCQVKEKIKETVIVQQSNGVTWESLLERGQMFLEDNDWTNANIYFEKVLDINPKCAEAYLGKLCVDFHCATKDNLQKLDSDISQNSNYEKAMRFAAPDLQNNLEKWNQEIHENIEAKRVQTEEKQHKNIDRLELARKRIDKVKYHIACGYAYMVGLKSDGTVVAVGDNHNGQCNVEEWTDIIAIGCVNSHQNFRTIGLTSGGTVIMSGKEHPTQSYNFDQWSNIIAISCGTSHIAGLKSDGTVVATGGDYSGTCDVADWKDIVAIACGREYTIGVKSDGTVVAQGSNEYGRCNVSDWSDIVAVACGECHTVGVKSDGTVVATGRNDCGECNVSDWSDIVAIACGRGYAPGNGYTVGIRSDGSIVTTGDDWGYGGGSRIISKWSDIVAIACGRGYIMGVKSDGTIETQNLNDKLNQGISSWKLFQSVDTIEDEWEKAKQERECEEKRRRQEEKLQKQMKLNQLEANQKQLQEEHSKLKGIFSINKRKKIEAELLEIQTNIEILKKKLNEQ